MRTMSVLVVVLVLAGPVMAQEIFLWFYGTGSTNLLESPVVYSGNMMPGGDIETGSWEIRLGDAGWPSDERERLPFLWETFFAANYVRNLPIWGGAGWLADLTNSVPTSTVDSQEGSWLPLWIQDDTNDGSFSGWCQLSEFVHDDNLNGIFDEDDPLHGLILMYEVLICEGEGVYEGLCGSGNCFGEFARVGTELDEGEEHWRFGMYLWLEDCMQGCDPPDSNSDVTGMPETWDSTWGTIKAMYR